MRRTLHDVVFAWKPAWTARVRGHVHDAGSGFTADEILTILSAGEAGLKVDDLCAAADIPVETYYSWKAKYRGLTPAKVRDLRKREEIVRRATVVGLAAAVVVTVGVPCAFLVARWTTRSASAAPTVAAAVSSPAPAPALPPTDSVPLATISAPQAAAPPAQPAPQLEQTSGRVTVKEQPVPVAQEVKADDVDASRSSGFAVQIAALPDLQEARHKVEQLAAAGYPAFLSPTSVGQGSLYRVRIGPLKTRHLAEEVAVRLQHDGYPAPWITK